MPSHKNHRRVVGIRVKHFYLFRYPSRISPRGLSFFRQVAASLILSLINSTSQPNLRWVQVTSGFHFLKLDSHGRVNVSRFLNVSFSPLWAKADIKPAAKAPKEGH